MAIHIAALYAVESETRNDAAVQVFGRRQWRNYPHAPAAGVRKAPRQEIAVGSAAAVRRGSMGILPRLIG
jgi:hypothetical protein